MGSEKALLNYLWGGMLLAGMLWGAINGTWDEVTQALLDSAKESVSLGITMLGILSFWCGIMEIGSQSGLIGWLAKRMTPVLDFLFPELERQHTAREPIAVNIIANMLGLGMAATPAGLKAMQEMEADIRDEARTATASIPDLKYFVAAVDPGYTDRVPEPVWIKTARGCAWSCACGNDGFYIDCGSFLQDHGFEKTKQEQA